MQIEVSVGEIVDKLSILEIKKNNITDKAKLENVVKEYDYLYDIVFNQLKIEFDDYNQLKVVNNLLWNVEDDIRLKEYKKEFDDLFITLARSVYVNNDNRARIKKDINTKYNSHFVEEKSYANYESIN